MKKIFTILLALIMSFTAMTALVKADEIDVPENGIDIHEYEVVDLQTIDKISYSTTFAIQGLSPMTFSYRIRTTGSILLLDQVVNTVQLSPQIYSVTIGSQSSAGTYSTSINSYNYYVSGNHVYLNIYVNLIYNGVNRGNYYSNFLIY